VKLKAFNILGMSSEMGLDSEMEVGLVDEGF
jgi:hypothetical protein